MSTTKHKSSKSIDINTFQNLQDSLLLSTKCCTHPLTENSYYCSTCKISTCPECDFDSHKSHELINKKQVYELTPTLFELAENQTENAIKFDNIKSQFIESLTKVVDSMKKNLDGLMNQKIKEVSDTFDNFTKNFTELKEIIIGVKQNLNDYVSLAKKFYGLGEFNNDPLNSIFFIHLELLNLIKNKNIQAEKYISEEINKFNFFKSEIEKHSQNALSEMTEVNNRKFTLESQNNNCYEDVNKRIKAYKDNITTCQRAMFDLAKEKGNLDDLNKIVDLSDAKNKKGIDVLFNQAFFMNKKKEKDRNVSSETKTKTGKDENPSSSNPSDSLLELNKISITGSTNRKRKRANNLRINKGSGVKFLSFNRSYDNTSVNNYTNTNNNNNNLSTNPNIVNTTPSNNYKNNVLNTVNYINQSSVDKDEIILDSKAKQNFFTYSIINLYNQILTKQKKTKDYNANDYIYDDYNIRYYNLIESAKPISGTNYILIYEQNKKLDKRKVQLDKEQHGYNVFPHGSRHIRINDKLYITGGTNSLGKPLSIALCYDIKNGTITRLQNMINARSYHSIELIENYDCFIVIGGEKNPTCELFDFNGKKWTNLPDLNVARANTCVYYCPLSCKIYTLFGNSGSISVPVGSEFIEYIELNNVGGGWIKVDYYKSSSIDLRNAKVYISPFTRSKLLIKGVTISRQMGKFVALFLLDKNEIIQTNEVELENIMKKDTNINLITQKAIKVKK